MTVAANKPKLFRDPVHDIIALAPGTDEGALLLALIDAGAVQRLRRIRQLALSALVYHGAEHSRFAHSIGVMHLARRMLDRVAALAPVDPDERLVTLAAALLHDVGHGPFSHALEQVTGRRHEARSVGIILHPETDVHRALAAVDPALPARVAERVRGRVPPGVPPFYGDVVASQLDADRFDYILRDGHATGVQIGAFDLARILTLLEVDSDQQHLAVNLGAREAVEGYLLARFHMYTQVYLHKASRAAERMLVATFARATELAGGAGSGAGAIAHFPTGPLGQLLRGEPLDEPEFVRVDDFDVWVTLKRWASESDRVLRDLAGGLVTRRLYKTLPLPAGESARAEELISAARSVARVKGFDPDYHVLVDESSDSPYRPYTGVDATSSIRLVDRSGRVTLIEDGSEVVQMLGRLHHQQRIMCFHPGLRSALARLLG